MNASEIKIGTRKVLATAKLAQAEAERYFTTDLKTAISLGFSINAETMTGSQGEMAKVDLKDKDGKIQRLAIFQSSEWGNGKGYVVFRYERGYAPEDFKPGIFGTLWHDDIRLMDVVEFVGERECC